MSTRNVADILKTTDKDKMQVCVCVCTHAETHVGCDNVLGGNVQYTKASIHI